MRPLGAAALLLAGVGSEEAPHSFCWPNGGEAAYERCCGQGDTAPFTCWRGPLHTEAFCCHALPAASLRCYDEIERRVLSKLGKMEEWKFGGPGEGWSDGDDAALGEFDGLYRALLTDPIQLWEMACQAPNHPLLWSEGCACCDPLGDACPEGRDGLAVTDGFVRCCHPVFARLAEEPSSDERLEDAIRAQLGGAMQDAGRQAVLARGPSLRWKFDEDLESFGCLVSVRQDGSVQACDELHACRRFDCSYLRAFMMTLGVIQRLNPLPDLDLVLNPADVTPYSVDASVPVFTRVGTRWTKTLALPVEWQLNPAQCRKQLSALSRSPVATPWEDRKRVLFWRGTASNCRARRCEIAQADDDPEAMESCGRLRPDEVRQCEWDFASWLRMPRGRLVWLARFSGGLIDAKLVASAHGRELLDPDLLRFLRSEGLFGDYVAEKRQDAYKYVIAVEGDSAADRVFSQLFLGATVLIPEGPWQSSAVLGLLQPFVHFVPVRYDLSDVVAKVEWLRSHDDEALRIARSGAAFARRYLTCDGVVHYVDRLLRQYAAKLPP